MNKHGYVPLEEFIKTGNEQGLTPVCNPWGDGYNREFKWQCGQSCGLSHGKATWTCSRPTLQRPAKPLPHSASEWPENRPVCASPSGIRELRRQGQPRQFFLGKLFGFGTLLCHTAGVHYCWSFLSWKVLFRPLRRFSQARSESLCSQCSWRSQECHQPGPWATTPWPCWPFLLTLSHLASSLFSL